MSEETRAEEAQRPDKDKESQYYPPDFLSHVLMLAATASMYLGESPHPLTEKEEKNLLLVRHSIDTLAMLQEKTRGNLTTEESKILETLLYELRMKFLQEQEKEKGTKEEHQEGGKKK